MKPLDYFATYDNVFQCIYTEQVRDSFLISAFKLIPKRSAFNTHVNFIVKNEDEFPILPQHEVVFMLLLLPHISAYISYDTLNNPKFDTYSKSSYDAISKHIKYIDSCIITLKYNIPRDVKKRMGQIFHTYLARLLKLQHIFNSEEPC